MAQEEKKLSKRGYVSPDTIWGFEEPENNLELRHCFELAKEFLTYSRDLQIFLTTHSPAFYSLNDKSKVHTFQVQKNDNDETSIKPIEDIESVNEEMGLLPLISPYIAKIYEREQEIEAMKLQLSLLTDNIKFLVLTEDERHEYLSSYLKIHGLEEDELEIVSYGSSSQFNSAAFKLAEYILKKKPHLKVIMHRDRDYLNNKEIEDILKKVEGKGYFPLIPQGVDIESIFVSSNHIHHLYPSLSIEQIDQIIHKCIDESEQDSIDRLTDHYFKNNGKPANGAYSRKFQELIVQYNSDKSRYFYGKKTFGLLKSELQKVLKSNTNLLRESPFIENAGLVEFICKQNPIAA